MVGLATPANVVIGTAGVDGRPCALSADEFTVRGGSAEGSIGDKRGHIERVARDLRVPIIRLLDGNSGGGSVGLYSKGGGGAGGGGAGAAPRCRSCRCCSAPSWASARPGPSGRTSR